MFDSETSSSKHNTGDIILHTDETTGDDENILASTPARRVFYEEDSDAASPIISRKRRSMILDSSLEDDSMIASPATSMMRDDLNVSQDDNAPDNSHDDPSDQHDSAQESGNQSLNSTGLHLHIGQHDLISDNEEPNISHSEFNVDEENINNLRPHFNEKILNIDEFFMKKAATTFGFQEPKKGGNSYSFKGYGHTLTTYISNSTIMIQPTDILFPTVYKSNFGGVVKYLALVVEYYQDPAKAERLREEKRKDLIKKRARSLSLIHI